MDALEIVCPWCVGAIRREMREVVELLTIDGAMEAEAQAARAVESEALLALGPTSPVCHTVWREGGEDWDWQHPGTVFAVHEMWVRAALDQENLAASRVRTISSAHAYLDSALTALAAKAEHVDEITELARHIRQLRAHLEALTHDSRAPERGAPCPECDDPRPLTKRYGGDVTGALDTWHCQTEPDHWWSEIDYRRRVGAVYLKHADTLNADDMEARTGVRATTIRGWDSKGRLTSCGKRAGRKVYRVADVETLSGCEHVGGDEL